MISFADYCLETLQQTFDGLITEVELLDKIEAAARGEMSGVAKPTNDVEAIGIG